jgi:3-deoxy-D-arabino-heptulosonate 7-phosphate (DAHP) synthase
MIEAHPDPEHALSDGPQSLHFKELEKLVGQLDRLAVFAKKNL